MGRLRNTIGTAAVLLAAAGFAALTAGSERQQGERDTDELLPDAARIERAFQASEAVAADPILANQLARAARKADRRPPAACASQTWPSILSGCLQGADDRSRPSVRSVTAEQKTGDEASILISLPAQQASSQP